MPELICRILKIGKTTYYKYVKENVPIVLFLKSFSKQELEEFLKTGKFRKFEESIFFDNFAEKICNKFFLEYYSRKRKNIFFAEVVFPEFKKSFFKRTEKIKKEIRKIKEKLEKNPDQDKEKYQHQLDVLILHLNNLSQTRYFSKINLFKFIIESDFKNKENLILELEEYNDMEIYMLVMKYERFLKEN